MQTVQGNMLESLRNAKQFLDEHAALLPDVMKTGARDRLVQSIATLASYQDTQAGNGAAAKSATQTHKALRQVLLQDHMAVISRIARFSLPNTPELQTLRMPRGRPAAVKLASDAYGMATTAESHASVFIEAGLPADFVGRLRHAADAMVGARDFRTQSKGRQRGATTGLKAVLTEGRRIVNVLDAMVRTALRDNKGLIANWNQVKRVAKVTGGRPASSTPAPSTTPATPKPTTAAPATTPSTTGH